MKTFLLLPGVIWLCLLASATGAQAPGEERQQSGVVLKWLGNAGWEIRAGETTILIDPFLTRAPPESGLEWKTNEEAVRKGIRSADYIFVGHSHADHVADVPFIAKAFGSKVIGSRTTVNLALTAGADQSQLLAISGGEKLSFRDFSVQVIRSEHGFITRGGHKRRPKFQEITTPRNGPIKGGDFVEGGCYLYYFSFGERRLLHQSTAGFIEDQLPGLRPDVLLLAATQRAYDLQNVLRTLEPKAIILHHFDQWRAPIPYGMPAANRRRAERFAAEIQAVRPKIKVMIPDFFAAMNLEP